MQSIWQSYGYHRWRGGKGNGMRSLCAGFGDFGGLSRRRGGRSWMWSNGFCEVGWECGRLDFLFPPETVSEGLYSNQTLIVYCTPVKRNIDKEMNTL